MIDVLSFFKEIAAISYCVVKVSQQFPAYRAGEDVDIFCFSPEEVTKKLLSWGRRYVDAGFRIRVKDLGKKKHVHVDFMRAGVLEFRFDLYGQLPAYEKLLLNPALFESIIENATAVEYPQGGATVPVRVPSAMDDLLIRYIEFAEWYDVRPDKIKHLEYILRELDEPARDRFLEKLHHYTCLPQVRLPREQEGVGVMRFFERIRARFSLK